MFNISKRIKDHKILGLQKHKREELAEGNGIWTAFPGGSDSKESACNAGNLDSIFALGRSAGEVNSYKLQYSYLEYPMDRRAWESTVHGVTMSQHDWAICTHFTKINSIWGRKLKKMPFQGIGTIWTITEIEVNKTPIEPSKWRNHSLQFWTEISGITTFNTGDKENEAQKGSDSKMTKLIVGSVCSSKCESQTRRISTWKDYRITQSDQDLRTCILTSSPGDSYAH